MHTKTPIYRHFWGQNKHLLCFTVLNRSGCSSQIICVAGWARLRQVRQFDFLFYLHVYPRLPRILYILHYHVLEKTCKNPPKYTANLLLHVVVKKVSELRDKPTSLFHQRR